MTINVTFTIAKKLTPSLLANASTLLKKVDSSLMTLIHCLGVNQNRYITLPKLKITTLSYHLKSFYFCDKGKK